MSSDERLARRAAEGDRHAFEQIYTRYSQPLYRFCLAMVGNPQDAQDTLQNTMVKVLRALPGEQREIRLKPWLYRIARNESIETLRRRNDSEELVSQQDSGVEVTELAESRERLRTLLRDLEQLPERQRAALVMRELAGLDFTQIGASFETSEAVARQTLYEARLSLRQLQAGREMRCADVMRELSDADGRVTRRREIRAHLRSCAECRAFKGEIGKRREDLAALMPLPIVAAAGLLRGVLGSKVGGVGGSATASGGAIAGSAGAGAGKAAATSALAKSAATLAVATVVGVSAADRSGLIELPFASRDKHAASPGSTKAVEPSNGHARAEPARSTAPGSHHAAHPQQDASRQPTGHDKESRGDRQPSEHAGGSPSPDGQGAAMPAENPSRSRSGSAPPGGGYGRSASDRHGRPEKHPEAAAHGQKTAGENRAGHAASPPPRGKAKGKAEHSSGGHGPPASKPTPPDQAKAPHAPAEAPPQANDNSGNPEQGGDPDESES
jgi:RNA polymerase sigma factor (sigma-70 family)